MMGRRALILLMGLPILTVIGLYNADHELAINVLAIVVLLLPLIDLCAALILTGLYMSRPAGQRSVSLGITTLTSWQIVLGLAMTALPAYNRVAHQPVMPYGDLLVALGFTLLGVTPVYMAGWIMLERRRRRDGTPPPEDGSKW